jgi:lipopolysaccharide/colanic/teichoic acid biosynthesis glycosyltransferase
MTQAYRALKRSIDVCVSGVSLVLFSPLLIALALLVRIRLGSPVLFMQLRPGLGGKPFRMIKFRSMNNAHDAQGRLLPDRERVTIFGQFLRASSLDELPELWNVLVGDMSLVGPRPLLMEYLPLYSKEQARRHEMRPGITGWAQVNGRNALSWEEKFRQDVWYVEHASLWLDCRILARTLLAVVGRRGITAAGSVTAEKFTGNRS